MKKIFIFALFCFVAGAAFGQYPANPNKIRLGNQTSGDGLVYRGSGAPAYTPSDYKNAWVYIDSVAGRMYTYRGGAWEFVSAGAGVDSTAFRNDSLFIYSPDTTFYVVIDRTFMVAGSAGTPQTVDPGQTVTIAAGNGVTTTAGATRTVTVTADTSVLASKTYTTNALALKLNLSDTAAMLTPYQRDISLTTTGTSGAATFSSNILNIPQYQAALTNPVTGTGTSGKVAKFTGTSSIGNGIASDDGTRFSLDDASTSTAKPLDFDSWTTAARPAVPSAGDAGWNTSNTNLDLYSGSAWVNLLKSATATGLGTAGRVFYSDANGKAAADDVFYWNYTDNRLGVDVPAPRASLEVNGSIISTSNSWTSRTSTMDVSYNGIAYGNGVFVTLGFNSTSFQWSPDGVNWTAGTLPVSDQWYAVAYGNGIFVAPSATSTGRLLASSDGKNWEIVTIGAQGWLDVCYGNGRFVAVSNSGTNRTMYSTNGTTWTTVAATEANSWNGVTYGNGKFVAVSSDGTNRVMYSTDGTSWTATSAAGANSWQGVTYGNGKFVAVSSDGTNRAMYSVDGVTWLACSGIEANSWSNVTYGEGVFVAVAGSGTNRIATSVDGITWKNITAPAANAWNNVTYAEGIFVAVAGSGTGNRVMTSGAINRNFPETNNRWNGDITVTGDLSFERPLILEEISPSADSVLTVYGHVNSAGNVWRARTSPVTGNGFVALAYGNGIWVAAYASSDTIIYSPDGVNWTKAKVPTSSTWRGLVFGDGIFVATSTNPAVGTMYSVDGVNWTNSAVGGIGQWWSIAYGAGRFVAVDANSAGIVALSDNGTSWTTASHGYTNVYISVAYGNGKFVAVTSGGTGQRIIYSTDGGATWTPATYPEENSYTDVAYGNGTWVAVASSGTNRIMKSADGITWTAVSTSTSGAWNDVVYGNGVFVAVANSGTIRIATSPDGTSWTAKTAPVTASWADVQYGDGMFVAVSSDNAPNCIATSGREDVSASRTNNTRHGKQIFTGEMRVTDLTTDTPTRMVGADADGDLGQMRFGSEIGWKTGDTLAILQQGATSGQALTWNGSNWRPTTISASVSDGDKGDVDVTSSGAVWTIDTNAVTTVKINAGAVTSAKLATGAVTGAVYGTVYYVPVDSINYDATTDLATYSEIHYYMYTGAGATANQVLTVPAASSTYAGKKIYVVSDDADQLDAYGLAVTSSSGATIRYYSGGDTGFSDNNSYASFGHGEGPNAVLFVCVQNPRTLAYRWVAYDGIRGGY